MKKKFLTAVSMALVTTFLFGQAGAYAAHADAVYREGSIFNDFDHAGVYTGGGTNDVYEIKGPYKEVERNTYSNFLDGKNSLGSYDNSNMTSTDNSNVLDTAASLDAEPGITYTTSGQIYHNAALTHRAIFTSV